MKKKAQRATSNVFSMFDQKQVQEFKEVFINNYFKTKIICLFVFSLRHSILWIKIVMVQLVWMI
jgi:hypothetical protein